jgi:hypothetical protein
LSTLLDGGQKGELVRTSDDENLNAEALMFAAAGVSLSQHTMHRAHDPEVETDNYLEDR